MITPNPSSTVGREVSYWADFHEVGLRTGRYVGGGAIAFYRRLRGLSYKQVLEELSG